MLVANDGFSAGHVVRMVAIARGLARRAAQRGIETRLLLATTSEAFTLLANEDIAVVHLPAPVAARRAGFSDRERRLLVHGMLAGIAESFAPDLLVVDTFPNGPHGEVAGLRVGRSKRALVRRSVPDAAAASVTDGIADYDLAIVADDPVTHGPELGIRTVAVPPITLGEARDALSRDDARAALGVDPGASARLVLVASGGGGDADAVTRAAAIAEAITRVAPDTTPVIALGPLVPATYVPPPSILVTRVAPLQRLLGAFDGAFAAAGYNTAHELAKAGVPAALFAQPRPFDDQAARAQRFANAGLACVLTRANDDGVAEALRWMVASSRRTVEAGGADRAADALLDLFTSSSSSSSKAGGTAR